MGGLVLDIGCSRQGSARGGSRVIGQLLGVVGDFSGVVGVAKEDNDVMDVEGVVESVNGCVNLEEAAY